MDNFITFFMYSESNSGAKNNHGQWLVLQAETSLDYLGTTFLVSKDEIN